MTANEKLDQIFALLYSEVCRSFTGFKEAICFSSDHKNVRRRTVIENSSTFHSFTTDELLRGADIPPGGLQQHMLELRIEVVLFTPGNMNDQIECDVRILQVRS